MIILLNVVRVPKSGKYTFFSLHLRNTSRAVGMPHPVYCPTEQKSGTVPAFLGCLLMVENDCVVI